MSDERRDPVAEQDEAARRFEARTGRKSTDPAPPGVMHVVRRPDGSIEAHTYGYDRDPDDEFDPFQRAGIERVHHAPAEIEQTPTAVVGHFKGGSDPRIAVAKLFSTPEAQAMIVAAAQPDPHGGAIETDVIDDPPVFLRRPDATCLLCRDLMRIFGDDKVTPECPRCHGTGDEPETE